MVEMLVQPDVAVDEVFHTYAEPVPPEAVNVMVAGAPAGQ